MPEEGAETARAVVLTQLPGLELGLSATVSPGSQRKGHGTTPTGRQAESGPLQEAVGSFLGLWEATNGSQLPEGVEPSLPWRMGVKVLTELVP